ncbi:hypothetical protein D3C72_1795970 [compost metagenome]
MGIEYAAYRYCSISDSSRSMAFFSSSISSALLPMTGGTAASGTAALAFASTCVRYFRNRRDFGSDSSRVLGM